MPTHLTPQFVKQTFSKLGPRVRLSLPPLRALFKPEPSPPAATAPRTKCLPEAVLRLARLRLRVAKGRLAFRLGTWYRHIF